MFSARYSLWAVDWKKSEVTWPILTQYSRILLVDGQQEKSQVAIYNPQVENESRSLQHMTQDHDFRLLGMSLIAYLTTLLVSKV